MTPEFLIENFERLAEAPGGVEKLRQVVLGLAVQGVLSDQQPTDGNAQSLVSNFDVEISRLVQQGEIKSPKPVEDVPEGEAPWSVPESWQWVRLARIGLINPRNDLDDTLSVSFVPMEAIPQSYGASIEPQERSWSELKKGYTHFAEGDIALAKITPCFENTKSAVMRGLLNGFGAGTTELHIFRPIGNILVPEYLLLFLKTEHYISTGSQLMTGTAGQKRVPKDYFAESPFPLPPFAEQARIVAKVDELMAKCDKLEKRQEATRKTRIRVHKASLNSLVEATTPDELSTAWHRLSGNFGSVLETPENVERLRDSLLDLAVMGKLIASTGSFKGGSQLVDEIEAKRAKRVASGMAPKLRPLSKPDLSEAPFKVPPGWGLTRLGFISDKIGSGSTPRGGKSVYVENGVIFLRSQNVWNGGLRLDEVANIPESIHQSMSGTHVKSGDLLLNITGASIGRCAKVLNEFETANVSQHVCIVRPTEPSILDFLHLYLISPIFQKIIMDVQVGMSREGLSKKRLEEQLIPLPPLELQQKIFDQWKRLDSLCALVVKQTEAGIDLRNLFASSVVHALAA